MSPRQAHKLLIEAGFVVDRMGKGGHRIYRRPNTPGFVTLSWHDHGRDINPRAAAQIKVMLKHLNSKENAHA